jgi:hypothetical protein
MSNMTPMQKPSPLERFSAGEISRSELGHLLGHDISFGETLAMLHEHGLPLPRYGRPFSPEGIMRLRASLRAAKVVRHG